MAVPSDMSILNISGKFASNKSLSDNEASDDILRLQGMGWVKRKIIGAGTLTLAIEHLKNADGIECINIEQTLNPGGLKTNDERVLDWAEKAKEDSVFGATIGQNRRVKAEDVEDEYLREGWTADTLEHGLIQSRVVSDTAKSGVSWTVNQTWGIEEIKGERRYARHMYMKGPKDEEVRGRLVYNYKSWK
ncbi:hypothetical protein F5050DRAFT_1710157 [Lentinula boryana]|uniref:Uncharacterized protein n=1 Tax=Lentinula boryana TaxID=40481 RepID=A0ABQ8QKI8_9AGAR|nr:hypothetical protein F5050DRAFT_1710157 [Lentinula boryana]